MIDSLGIYFSHSDHWPYLLLIPILIALYIRTATFRKTVITKLTGLSGRGIFDTDALVKPALRGIKTIFFILGVSCISIAVLGPQWGQKAQVVKAQGLDICFALDLSRSMLAEDVMPSRLGQAKNQLSIFLPSLGGDRAALVGFSGTGFVAAPLSADYSALSDFLDPMDPSFVSSPTTNLASGVDACLTALGLEEVKSREEIADASAKLVVLVSDGEDQADDYKDALSRCEKLGIPVYAMAAGTTKGGAIPLRDPKGNITNYIKGPDGQPVLSRLEDKALKEIAKRTGGSVFYSSTGVDAWKKFAEATANYKRDSKDAGTKMDREERFQWPLLLGIILLLLDFFMPETGFRRANTRRNLRHSKKEALALMILSVFVCKEHRAWAQASPNASLPADIPVKPGTPSIPEPPPEPPPAESPLPDASQLPKTQVLKGKHWIPTDPEAVKENNAGVSAFKKQDFSASLEHVENSLHKDAANPYLRFNWASSKMFSALNKDKSVNPKITDEAIREFENLKKDLALDSSREAKDLHRLLDYQLGQAYELKKDTTKALQSYYQSLSEGTEQTQDIDVMARKNISRLITKNSSGSGGGQGESKGDKGDQGGNDPKGDKGQEKNKKPLKDGDDHKDQKVKPKYSGTEITEQEARQILESVSNEEKDVQKRKAQGAAREKASKDAKEKGTAGGDGSKPW